MPTVHYLFTVKDIKSENSGNDLKSDSFFTF